MNPPGLASVVLLSLGVATFVCAGFPAVSALFAESHEERRFGSWAALLLALFAVGLILLSNHIA